MRRRVRLDRLAELELQEAISWYDERRPGLGLRFWSAVDSTMRILEGSIDVSLPYPDAPSDLPIRRIFVRSFPYQLVFVGSGDEIRVIAVAHFAREPRYWIDRLGVDDPSDA